MTFNKLYIYICNTQPLYIYIYTYENVHIQYYVYRIRAIYLCSAICLCRKLLYNRSSTYSLRLAPRPFQTPKWGNTRILGPRVTGRWRNEGVNTSAETAGDPPDGSPAQAADGQSCPAAEPRSTTKPRPSVGRGPDSRATSVTGKQAVQRFARTRSRTPDRPSGRPRRRLGRQSMLLFGRRAGQPKPGGASQHRRAAARLTDDVGSTVSSLQVPRRSIKTLQNLKLLPKNTFIKP